MRICSDYILNINKITDETRPRRKPVRFVEIRCQSVKRNIFHKGLIL